ncbi:patatin-like phospholipase family protein [Piscinibacter sp. HJYY11]|uniref:patatin-like phospholipase family protein n=1 Tax=Piscinibacter sp. HJYY11 TaxID=2801333 RepID=UPI00191F1D51|nr:patatin-like phospholipase family protein [Piscinibacter sp. HJYY11]MBL0726150.1 patatin-like phospholipase family protein [Piscinibacter sp. HJYY11]
MPKTYTDRPLLQLALQGGGAHGAFTWGVLDRLLDEPHIDIGHVSGSSAGSLNGAALVSGLATSRTAAKASLQSLWTKIAEAGSLMTFLLLPLRKPGMGLWDDAMPLLSPYQTNLLGMEPLRYVVEQVIDFDALNRATERTMFVNAMNVRSGCARVFSAPHLSTDVLLASSCAPLVFQAVEIEGDAYWDGSYAANPHLWPLYHREPDCDILLVELTPLNRPERPTTAKNILNRINETASINGLISELRALDIVNRTARGADVRLHVVSLDDTGSQEQSEPSVKRTVSRVLFERLRLAGSEACEQWLKSHGAKLGNASTVDIVGRYLAPYAQPPVAD